MAGVAPTGTLQVPALGDILAARKRIRRHLEPSPLRNYPSLDRLVGAEVWVKHENLLPTGAFKVRGGINLMSRLDAATRARGVIAASTGNHGQSVALAARLFGVSAIICAPEAANPVKVEAMRDLGAEVVLVGRDFDDAREHCERLAAEHGYRYIHSGNEPDLISGVGTHTLEVMEEQPDIEVVIVPVGGGSGAAGACIAAKSIRPGTQVIAVQSTAAPTAHDSWSARALVERPNTTIAEGLSTRTGFELPQRIMQELLDDFVMVSDEELIAATGMMIAKTRTLVEPAGAAPLAAALSPALRGRIAGRRVALICSGGNISPAQLALVVR
jgi:threonine dehydratase